MARTGRPRTTRAWKLALRRDREARRRRVLQSGSEAARRVVDAVRAVLGMAPLYRDRP